jgi:hypothetical protein
VFAGPNLPNAIEGAAMVPTPDGTGVVLIGGRDTGANALNKLYELKCSSSDCDWIEMEQKLTVSRSYHVAMYVPESFVGICEN